MAGGAAPWRPGCSDHQLDAARLQVRQKRGPNNRGSRNVMAGRDLVNLRPQGGIKPHRLLLFSFQGCGDEDDFFAAGQAIEEFADRFFVQVLCPYPTSFGARITRGGALERQALESISHALRLTYPDGSVDSSVGHREPQPLEEFVVYHHGGMAATREVGRARAEPYLLPMRLAAAAATLSPHFGEKILHQGKAESVPNRPGTAGVIGTCASAIMRSGAMMAGSAVTAVGGGAWAGAPDVVQQVIGGAAGAGSSDLARLQPAALDAFTVLSSIVTSLFV
jgi:hypothetical protein